MKKSAIAKNILTLIMVLVVVWCNLTVFAEYNTIDLSEQSGYSNSNYVYNGYTYERMITYTGVEIPLGETVTLEFESLENYNILEGAAIDTGYFNLVSESGRSVTVTALKAGTSHIDFVYMRYTNSAQTSYAKCMARVNITITTDLVITLTDTEKTMTMNKTKYLQATVTPNELYINNIDKYGCLKWTSSNADCVSISCGSKSVIESDGTQALYTNLSDGAITLTSKEAGTAVISCELALDSTVKATCVVTVIDPTKAVTGVTLDISSAYLTMDETETLTATVKPLDATNQNVTWSSSNTNIVIVSGGKLYPQNIGTATVTVTTDDGGYTAACTVTVYEDSIAVTGITLPDTFYMYVGYTAPLTAAIEPSNATNQNVIWTSSNADVAYIVNSVDKSKIAQIKGVASGTAILTAATEDGNLSAVCTVTVGEEEAYTWSLEEGILTISGTGAMPDYEVTSDLPWYSQRLDIYKIVVSDGITSIGTKAFYGCINATSIEIPESVISIGENALKNCDEISISGKSGSYAHEYAISNNISFVDITPTKLLADLSVEFNKTASRWYFDIAKDTYAEDAVIYVGIYDENNNLLTVKTENMVSNDVTSISINIIDNYSYAKVFEWVNMKPAANLKPIPLN